MLLPREHLPLSYLDLSDPHADLPTGRNYESNIRILELEGRLGSNVLISASNSSQAVYAVEREVSGLYVICKLGSWVRLDELTPFATVVCRQRLQPPTLSTAIRTEFEPALVMPQTHKENKRKRLAIEQLQSMVRKRPREQTGLENSLGDERLPSLHPVASIQAASQDTDNGLLAPHVAETPATVEPIQGPPGLTIQSPFVEQVTAESIFQSIRSQYLEVLYRSMVRLQDPRRPALLNRSGLPCILCQRSPFSGPSRLPPGLRLEFRNGRLDRVFKGASTYNIRH
jgi:DNA replication regulator SLD3